MSWRAPEPLRSSAGESREPLGEVPRKTTELRTDTLKGLSETATPSQGAVTEPRGPTVESRPRPEPSENRVELRQRSRRRPISDRIGGASRDRPRGLARLVTCRRRHLNIRSVVAGIALASLLAPGVAAIILAAL